MKHNILLNGRQISYELTRKKVKNINIRIKPNGEMQVSAGKNVPLITIEELLKRKEGWILRVLEEVSVKKETLPENHSYLCGKIIELPAGISRENWQKAMAQTLLPRAYEKAWQLFEQDGFPKPALRLRKMKSRWGSCIPAKGIITLNTALIGADEHCQMAVAAHELCHMLHPNHSSDFYAALEARFPVYRKCWENLKSAQKFLLDS